MLFNSVDFAVFLPIVFALYWLIPRERIRIQNSLLILASYIFYSFWDWRFLSLIVISSLVDYVVGLGLSATENRRRRIGLLLLSLGVNLGMLGYFKYSDFFVQSFADAFTLLGYSIRAESLGLILPVGISFYTFQTLSYTIDAFRGRMEATRDPIAFFAYVCFFPQLVAGPIERANHLLPQFLSPRSFDYDQSRDGLRQILWGLFKKAVVADNCARYVDLIYSDYESQAASTLLLGMALFVVQVYGDFGGYSDVAIGTSKLFGFRLRQNFSFPFFSRDLAEFWRRWHISLTTWFRDYVYSPLGGSQGGKVMSVRNTIIVFVVSGFWHGANWTFVIWGGLNALLFIPLLLSDRNRRYLTKIGKGRTFPTPLECWQMGTTFLIHCVSWVYFRSPTVSIANGYLLALFSPSLFTIPALFPLRVIGVIGFMLVIEWIHRFQQHGLQLDDEKVPRPVRWLLYLGLCFAILSFGVADQQFIYFQF